MSLNILKEPIKIIQLFFEAAWPTIHSVVSEMVIVALQDCNFYKRKLFGFHLSLQNTSILEMSSNS